jgi:hypothetical protein
MLDELRNITVSFSFTLKNKVKMMTGKKYGGKNYFSEKRFSPGIRSQRLIFIYITKKFK